jgi:enamine deaminase RidA (YjgF/YER057c/UK114 family)
VDRPVSQERQSDPTPHRIVNPDNLGRPVGFSHAVAATPGRTIYLAGQTGHAVDDSLPDGLVEQFDAAAGNVVTALEAAGGRPEYLVSMQVFVTDLARYTAESKAIGQAYRKHFGRHFPAMALIEVTGLADGAKVEIMCVAVVPA